MVSPVDWNDMRRRLPQTPERARWIPSTSHGLQTAGVLVPLVERLGEKRVILTRRSASLRDHAGQIGFPGGRIESHDASPEDAARREADEEIGVSNQSIETLGYLPPYRTGTGFLVFPSVACVASTARLTPCPVEVAEIFEVPLGFVLDPANHCSHVIEHAGAQYRLGTLPYQDYFIWGATAGMLLTLYGFVTGQPPSVDPQGERVWPARDLPE